MVAAADSIVKRKLGEGEEAEKAVVGDTKRAAGGTGATPEAMVPHMRNEDFSPELLRIYYDKMFPFKAMTKWLSYGNNPKSQRAGEKDYFLRREFTFVLQGDVFCRYMCFKDAEEFRSQMIARQPIRMEIGAVFTHPPKNHKTVVKEAYRPVERELVFDIDMDDYDSIRTCCSGANICLHCWTFMRAAIKVLDRALREDFGFKHILFVYSGRRGVHCWIGDRAARELSNEYRGAIVEYLNLVTPGANKARSEVKNFAEEVHPSVEHAYKICEGFFKDDPMGVLKAQDIFKKGPHLQNIMEQCLSVEERAKITKFTEANPGASSHAIWLQLEALRAERSTQAGGFKAKQANQMFLKDVVIQFTYPRLDINVSKQMNHLLKAPFVVHPKTGRVCVPINPATADSFNPTEVPTIGRLVDELNRTGDMDQTSFKSYIDFFVDEFLTPLLAECAKERPHEQAQPLLDW